MNNEQIVTEIIKKKVDVSGLNKNSKLTDLGLDSLDLVEIMLEIEETLKIEFSSDEIASLTTLGSVLDLIEKKTA